MRSTSEEKVKGPIANMLEKILALGQNHRSLITDVLTSQYFISDP